MVKHQRVFFLAILNYFRISKVGMWICWWFWKFYMSGNFLQFGHSSGHFCAYKRLIKIISLLCVFGQILSHFFFCLLTVLLFWDFVNYVSLCLQNFVSSSVNFDNVSFSEILSIIFHCVFKTLKTIFEIQCKP